MVAREKDDPLPILRLPGTIYDRSFSGYRCPRKRC